MTPTDWAAAGRRLHARLQDPPTESGQPPAQPRNVHPQLFLPDFQAAGLPPSVVGRLARSPVLAALLEGLKRSSRDDAEAIFAALGVLAGR